MRLVERTLHGDLEASERLFARLDCIPRILYRLNQRRGEVLSRHDLEDVTQDVLLAVWTRLDTFGGQSTLETWSFSFCRHQLMNAIRKKRTALDRHAVGALDEPRPTARDAALELDPVHACLDTLNDDQARVIRSKHFDHQTFEEIGQRFAIPTNTAKTLYYRGLEQMRLWFARRVGGEPA